MDTTYTNNLKQDAINQKVQQLVETSLRGLPVDMESLNDAEKLLFNQMLPSKPEYKGLDVTNVPSFSSQVMF